jgi:hypothetical protein
VRQQNDATGLKRPCRSVQESYPSKYAEARAKKSYGIFVLPIQQIIDAAKNGNMLIDIVVRGKINEGVGRRIHPRDCSISIKFYGAADMQYCR